MKVQWTSVIKWWSKKYHILVRTILHVTCAFVFTVKEMVEASLEDIIGVLL